MARLNLDKLTEDLRACKKIAEEAIHGVSDHGTCNRDSPTLRGPKSLTPRLEAALKAAGVDGFYARYHGIVLSIGVGGQGYSNTVAAEAFSKALKTLGYDSGMYYQMD